MDKAQHECLRNQECSAVYGHGGNAFGHTQFNLCLKGKSYSAVKRTNFKGMEERYNPNLPDSLYMKPGKELSIRNSVEIPKI